MRTILYATACAVALSTGTAAYAQGTKAKRDTAVERGRYLVKIGGCNDCHTANYEEKAGAVPENMWLTGTPVGFQGPWGTTYPANLRLVIDGITEEQWMKRARQALRPPMPWFNLRDMTDGDLRAIYRYVKSLGPAGQPAPAFVAPGQKAVTPFIVLDPPSLPGAR